MKYDESYLLEAAQRFEDEARWIVWTCAARYAALGILAGVGGGVGFAAMNPAEGSPAIFALGGSAGFVGGILIGVRRGRRLAFRLRVEAQKLIALVQIERNTESVPAAVMDK